MMTRILTVLLLVAAATAAYFNFSTAKSGAKAGNENASPLHALQIPDHEPDPAPFVDARSLSESLPTKGHWRGKPVLADLNGDGKLDLAASIRRWDQKTPGEGLSVWLGDGKGKWTETNVGLRRDMSYGGAEAGDVNGDGRIDIAFTGHNTEPHVFLNNITSENPYWVATAHGIDVKNVCADVALGDLTGDGKTDLVLMGQFPKTGGLYVFKGDGDGGFERMAELLEPRHYGSQTMIDDLDGDGRNEVIAVTSAGTQVKRLGKDGKWEDLSKGFRVPDIGGTELGLATRDFDGDGHKEIVVAGMGYAKHDALMIFRRVEGEWKMWGEGLPTDENFFDVDFARLGGKDGPVSIVAAGQFGISIIDMVAPGKFKRRARIRDTRQVYNLATGDVTGDGRDEIVFVGIGGVRVLDLASQ